VLYHTIELKEVAGVRSAPFAFLLGINWIIASKNI
jgi:nucleoside permease NupC